MNNGTKKWWREGVSFKQYDSAQWLRERGWTVIDTPKHPRTQRVGPLTARARRGY